GYIRGIQESTISLNLCRGLHGLLSLSSSQHFEILLHHKNDKNENLKISFVPLPSTSFSRPTFSSKYSKTVSVILATHPLMEVLPILELFLHVSKTNWVHPSVEFVLDAIIDLGSVQNELNPSSILESWCTYWENLNDKSEISLVVDPTTFETKWQGNCGSVPNIRHPLELFTDFLHPLSTEIIHKKPHTLVGAHSYLRQRGMTNSRNPSNAGAFKSRNRPSNRISQPSNNLNSISRGSSTNSGNKRKTPPSSSLQTQNTKKTSPNPKFKNERPPVAPIHGNAPRENSNSPGTPFQSKPFVPNPQLPSKVPSTSQVGALKEGGPVPPTTFKVSENARPLTSTPVQSTITPSVQNHSPQPTFSQEKRKVPKSSPSENALESAKATSSQEKNLENFVFSALKNNAAAVKGDETPKADDSDSGTGGYGNPGFGGGNLQEIIKKFMDMAHGFMSSSGSEGSGGGISEILKTLLEKFKSMLGNQGPGNDNPDEKKPDEKIPDPKIPEEKIPDPKIPEEKIPDPKIPEEKTGITSKNLEPTENEEKRTGKTAFDGNDPWKTTNTNGLDEEGHMIDVESLLKAPAKMMEYPDCANPLSSNDFSSSAWDSSLSSHSSNSPPPSSPFPSNPSPSSLSPSAQAPPSNLGVSSRVDPPPSESSFGSDTWLLNPVVNLPTVSEPSLFPASFSSDPTSSSLHGTVVSNPSDSFHSFQDPTLPSASTSVHPDTLRPFSSSVNPMMTSISPSSNSNGGTSMDMSPFRPFVKRQWGSNPKKTDEGPKDEGPKDEGPKDEGPKQEDGDGGETDNKDFSGIFQLLSGLMGGGGNPGIGEGVGEGIIGKLGSLFGGLNPKSGGSGGKAGGFDLLGALSKMFGK
ncbi:hypothetical protein HMI56_006688, partial [Coelomomyces lativittatus]